MGVRARVREKTGSKITDKGPVGLYLQMGPLLGSSRSSSISPRAWFPEQKVGRESRQGKMKKGE